MNCDDPIEEDLTLPEPGPFPPTLIGVSDLDYIIISYLPLDTLVNTFCTKRKPSLMQLGTFLGGGRSREISLSILNLFHTMLIRRLGEDFPLWLATDSMRSKPKWETEMEWFTLNLQPYNDILMMEVMRMGLDPPGTLPSDELRALSLFDAHTRPEDCVVPTYAVDTIPLVRAATARLIVDRVSASGPGPCYNREVDHNMWNVICTLARACGHIAVYPSPVYAVLTDLIVPYLGLERTVTESDLINGVYGPVEPDEHLFTDFVTGRCLPWVLDYGCRNDRSSVLAWVKRPELLVHISTRVMMWFLTMDLYTNDMPTLLPDEQDVIVDAILGHESTRRFMRYISPNEKTLAHLDDAINAGMTHRVDGMTRILSAMGSEARM